MADKIQIRAGNKAGMPTLTDRELAYVRDENALYIGTTTGNKDINGELKQAVVELQATVTAQQAALNGKLTASPVAAQAAIASDADLAAVVSAVNALIAAMKSSGVMNN